MARLNETWDETCDVLVVGSGAGGMVGAYVAAREGHCVILVEASDKFGGTSAYSGGGMWFPCSAPLRRAGDDDRIEDALAYYRAVVGDRTPAALQETYVRSGSRLVDYLEADPDFPFMVYPWPDYFGAQPKARASGRHVVLEPLPAAALGDRRTRLRATLSEERRGAPPQETLIGGQALIGRFLLALSKKPNADLRLRSAFVEYVMDSGAVIGAVIETPHDRKSGRKRIRARGGIIVAAGGFEHNAALRTQSGMPGTVAGAMGPNTNTGQPIVAGMAIGAATDLMDQAWWSPGLRHPDSTFAFSLGYVGGIFVDQTGRRFMNESLPYDRAGREMIARIKAGKLQLPIWMIYDNRDNGVPPVQYPNVPFAATAEYRAAGCWVSAPTLADLAARIGVPADALTETVARFNTLAATGHDSDFGRGTEPYERMFTEGRAPLAQIITPPFHAAAFELSDLGTKGGLKTDTAARVLGTTGAPIPGLYAAGNSMAAASGEAYPGGGNPIGSSMVFAFLAAQDIGARLT